MGARRPSAAVLLLGGSCPRCTTGRVDEEVIFQQEGEAARWRNGEVSFVLSFFFLPEAEVINNRSVEAAHTPGVPDTAKQPLRTWPI